MKKMLWVSAVVSTLGLTACGGGGGGGSSSSTNSTATTATPFDSFSTYQYGLGSSTTNAIILFGGVKYQKRDNAIYGNPIGIGGATSMPSGSNFDGLTDSGFYKANSTLYAQGYARFGNLISVTNDTLVSQMTLDVQATRTIESFDLSNLPLTTRTNVYFIQIFNDPTLTSSASTNPNFVKSYPAMQKFVAAQQVGTFSLGAKCFKWRSRQYTKPYFTFDSSSASVATSLDAWISAQKAADNAVITTGTWAGISWARADHTASDGWQHTTAAVLYNNNVLSASYVQNWTSADDVAIAQHQLTTAQQSGNANQIKFATYALQDVQDRCDGYNDIAAADINRLITNATQ